MAMSDATSLVLVSAITTVPTVLAIIIAARMQMSKVEQVAQVAREAAAGKDSASGAKLDVIHTLVNSRLTDEIKSKEAALDRVRALEKEISDRYKRDNGG